MGLETVDLNGLGIKLQTFLLVGEELLNILALISLKLNHLAHLSIDNDSAIASELLFNDLEDLLLVKFLGEALDSRQSLTTIALLDTDVYVVLRLLGLSCIFIRFGEGVKRFQIFDARHKRYLSLLWRVVLVLVVSSAQVLRESCLVTEDVDYVCDRL